MLVFRRIAAAYVPAGKAEPQVDPLVSGFHTIFADVLVGGGDTNLIFVLAMHSPDPRFLRAGLSRRLAYFQFAAVPVSKCRCGFVGAL